MSLVETRTLFAPSDAIPLALQGRYDACEATSLCPFRSCETPERLRLSLATRGWLDAELANLFRDLCSQTSGWSI
jgi:hypothetical protein